MEKIDILYIVFNLKGIRLRIFQESLCSIDRKRFNICVCDTGEHKIHDFGFDRYYHHPCPPPFNKSFAINTGYKKLITSDSFIVSDADIIFPSHMKDFHKYNKKDAFFLGKPFIHDITIGEKAPNHPQLIKSIANFIGGLFMTNKFTFDTIGGFDEGYNGWGHEDRDFTMLYYIRGNKPYTIIKEIIVVHKRYTLLLAPESANTMNPHNENNILLFNSKFTRTQYLDYLSAINEKKKNFTPDQ